MFKLFKIPTIADKNFLLYGIKQGDIANSYFHFALGEVASNPENIANPFVYVDKEQLKYISNSGD